MLSLYREDVVIVHVGNVTLLTKKGRIQGIQSLPKRFKEEQGLENLT